MSLQLSASTNLENIMFEWNSNSFFVGNENINHEKIKNSNYKALPDLAFAIRILQSYCNYRNPLQVING